MLSIIERSLKELPRKLSFPLSLNSVLGLLKEPEVEVQDSWNSR